MRGTFLQFSNGILQKGNLFAFFCRKKVVQYVQNKCEINRGFRMNLKEVCQKFGYSESYVSKNFPRVQKAILTKWGINIQKKGRGAAAQYIIVQDNSRAITLYKEDERTVALSQSEFKHIINMNFATFLGIIMTPLQVFRGSYDDFLRYIQMSVTDKNRENLKNSLDFLAEHNYIHYAIDKTSSDFFFAGIYRKVEEQITVGINMIRICKQLAAQHHKRSWVPLLKLWMGIKYLYINGLQPYTIQDLVDLTGLSVYQIRESGKVLEQDNAFVTDKVYLDYTRCLGKTVQLNVIHDGNQM